MEKKKTNKKKDGIWDVVIVGGGPAGMMAAGRAGERGLSVLLLEKNKILGKKLLITGGGRCNLTNNKPIRTLVSHYQGSDQFLMSAFVQYDVEKTLQFFKSKGVRVKEEAGGRMFPVSDSSQTIVDALVKYMKQGDVEVWNNAEVKNISIDKKTNYVEIEMKKGKTIRARSCVCATGGTSRPDTGSTGEGFGWLADMGHTIIQNDYALVPIAIKNGWVKRLSGITLENIKLTVLQDEKKQESKKGRVLFTHFGISGPTVLNMSKGVGDLLHNGDVVIMLDVFPPLDHGALRKKLQEILVRENNKKIKNTLDALIPTALVSGVLSIAGVNGDTPNHSVRSEERVKIVETLKALPMHVKGLLGANRAIVSSGGVELKEVDFKTMRSRVVPQIFLVGDTLNINRPSGGYSLQLCWTTGYIAGDNAGV